MRRWRARMTKVGCGLHNAAAEVMLPNAVRQHARSQRILSARGPIGEGAAAPCAGSIRAGISQCGSLSAQHRKKGRLDLGTRITGVPTYENVCWWRLQT